MIVDSSAIFAILRREEDAEVFARILSRTSDLKMSAGTYIECATIIEAPADRLLAGFFDELLQRSRVEVVPLTARHAFRGREAYRMFGKGTGHKARLNLGDCFAYALAKDLDEPLLFKGNDFIHTDVRRAL